MILLINNSMNKPNNFLFKHFLIVLHVFKMLLTLSNLILIIFCMLIQNTI
jgi:hypothetical protein